jgi:PAS domain S-box-containing protein
LSALDAPALRRLYGASRRLGAAEGAAELYQALVEAACAAGGAEAAALYRPRGREAQHGLVCAGATGGWEPPPQLPAVDTARMALAPGALTPAAAFPGAAALGADVALLPLAGAAHVHGVLACRFPDGRAPAPVAAALAALADDGARSLDRLARRDEAARQAQDGQPLLAAVNTVTDLGLLHGSMIERLLDAVLAQILAVLPLGGGALYLYDEPFERLELAAWARGPEAAFGPDPAELWTGPAREAALAHARETARAGYPTLTVDPAPTGEPPGSLAAALREMGGASLASVPLMAGGWLTGVLQVIAPGRGLTAEHVQALRTLARQAAATIENARLYAQARGDQERARAVVDATNDAIVMIDEHRRPMIVNRRARFFFGLTERDLLGKSFDQIGGMFARIFEDGQRFDGWLGQLLRSRHERALEEFRILSPEPRLLQCYSAPVTDLFDRYLGRLLVFRDITREREVERMKSEFVSIVSHELRTPLTSIQGALQLVLGQPESGHPGMAEGISARGRELLSISRANTERLIRLINDILDIAKIEQGRIQLRREPLSPEELCRSAAGEISVFANSRGISVELQVRPGLPQVLADRDRAVQVLVNLLSNAVKFSPAGQRVVLSVRHDGAMVSFAVQDWGRGIDPAQQSRLFQKFQQIDSSPTRDVGGTGLGLAISKTLVEEQGGRMWLDSQPGEGSVFSFTLPAAPGAEARGAPQAEIGGQTRALVVDDDPHVRPVLVRLLQRHGIRAADAGDGYGALAAVEAERPDVILLDIQMPGLDGLEVLRRLKGRAETADIPVIILSANDLSDSARAQGLALGADAYLEKPIAYERLISTVNAVMGLDKGAP